MWQMTGLAQHQIVMFGAHGAHVSAKTLPHLLNDLDRFPVSISFRRDQYAMFLNSSEFEAFTRALRSAIG